ncbi:MAG: sugar transferase [Chitinispirillaceae bacterium]|nr:sugar transferase [Chitinispirillaceae bacterium]
MRTGKDEIGLYREHIFAEFLRLERRRTERSKIPFVLIIIEISHFIKMNAKSSLRDLAGILDECYREVDIKGWYKKQSIIGIICPDVSGTMIELLRQKFFIALEKKFPDPLHSGLVVSFICFPEDESIDATIRNRIYPELKVDTPERAVEHICKRAMDIAVALLMLVIGAPIMLVAAAAIKLTSPGPVLFRQERVGLGGRIFTFFKFRSMHVGNDNTVHKEFITSFIKARNSEQCSKTGAFKLVNDHRVTPVGRILRKTSIDELPQLFNVLRGDMSLVGPRPPVQYEVDIYDLWHRRRVMEVKPGITGFWQVYGRSRTSFENMVRMDIHYIRNRNFFFDIALLLRTPLSLVKGAY